jgi:uncharacterized protein YegP (UPF0339 family)
MGPARSAGCSGAPGFGVRRRRRSGMADQVKIYQGENGDWYWDRLADNGKIVADSAEGYVNKAHAERMARRINGDGVSYVVQPSEE